MSLFVKGSVKIGELFYEREREGRICVSVHYRKKWKSAEEPQTMAELGSFISYKIICI